MTGYSSKRQPQWQSPSHHTSTFSPPSKGCKKGKGEEDARVGGDCCEIMKTKRKGVKGQDVSAIDENKKQMKNAADDVSSQDDAGMKPEDVAKLSIQSQSELQPPRGMGRTAACISAEAKKDVDDESGRLAVSKAEVERLLLPSKQAAYGNGENYREEPTLPEKTVSPNVDQAEVGSYLYSCSFSINRIHDLRKHSLCTQATTTALSSSAVYNPHRYQWLSACGGAKGSGPISKETMPQDGSIVAATEGSNKSPECFEDIQRSVVWFANGTKKETLKCGEVSHCIIGTIHSLTV